ncbi:MAG: hypothetical protein BMS9Abin20_1535 [Acidimicrobiia bacterium]|nr:MAG: hypothetical protein BMS9Abin20_1535 [Acidimicrobiia bacterium]
MKWLIAGLAGLAGIIVVAAIIVVSTGDTEPGERADIAGQGGEGSVLAVDGARLDRADDGLVVGASVPTPTPGSYEYPTGDMVAKWATPHPDVEVGGPGEPEAFTMWAIIFNYPELCTDDSCDLDDLAEGAAAKGGVYQADGRIAEEAEVEFVGSIRLGQPPRTGSALENPLEAEVHLAIAPHGKALSGADGWRQLNGPLGNPTLWWAATFSS